MSGDQRQAPPADLREQHVRDIGEALSTARNALNIARSVEKRLDRLAPPADLREQIERAIGGDPSLSRVADRIEAVYAERERLLRERIEALRKPFIGQTRYGYNDALDDALEVLWPQLP